MSKEIKISIRVKQSEFEQIVKKAAAENITVSEYIRRKVNTDTSKDSIRKDILVPLILYIAEALDKEQCKDNQTVRKIRKIVKKIWDLL